MVDSRVLRAWDAAKLHTTSTKNAFRPVVPFPRQLKSTPDLAGVAIAAAKSAR